MRTLGLLAWLVAISLLAGGIRTAQASEDSATQPENDGESQAVYYVLLPLDSTLAYSDQFRMRVLERGIHTQLVAIRDLSQLDWLSQRGIEWHLVTSTAPLPSPLPKPEQIEDRSLFLVKTKPSLESTRSPVEGPDTTVLQYVGDDEYLAWMPQARADSLASDSRIAWVQEWSPKMRMLPLAITKEAGGLLRLVFVDDETLGQELSDLPKAGLYPLSLRQEGPLREVVAEARQVDLEWLSERNSLIYAEWAGADEVLEDEIATEIVGGVHPTPALAQVHSWGWDGSGSLISIIDTGIDRGTDFANMHLDLRGRINAVVDYCGTNGVDASGHGTHVAGIAAGDAATGTEHPIGKRYGLGVAPEAHLVTWYAPL